MYYSVMFSQLSFSYAVVYSSRGNIW